MKKITLVEFCESKKPLLVHFKEREQAKQFWKMARKLGYSLPRCEHIASVDYAWDRYENDLCFDNIGGYGTKYAYMSNNYPMYEFNEIDLSSQERIYPAKLNDRNEDTKGIIHLFVTPLCNRNCPFCCNKQYNMEDVPFVTDAELEEAHTLLITGGEPFKYAQPCEIAGYYKERYPNIKNIYVYSNAKELSEYIENENDIYNIDGLSISIKNQEDKKAFEQLLMYFEFNSDKLHLSSNRLYVFQDCLIPEHLGNFQLIKREWQKEFEPASDSIFRRI